MSGQTVTGDDFGNHKRTAPSGCTDRAKPTSLIKELTVLGDEQGLRVKGTAKDFGPQACRGLAKVVLSLARVTEEQGQRCQFVKSKNEYRLTDPRSCSKRVLFTATGLKRWRFTFDVDLSPGQYLVDVRAVDKSGNKEAFHGRSLTIE